MLSTVDVDKQGDEDKTGDVQIVDWRDLLAEWCRELGSQVVEVTGRVSGWDAGISSVTAGEMLTFNSTVIYPL